MSFSVHSQYVVNHPFRWQGRDRKRGEPFDVRMNPRQCKLLFEKRSIVPAGDYRGPLTAAPVKEPTNQELEQPYFGDPEDAVATDGDNPTSDLETPTTELDGEPTAPSMAEGRVLEPAHADVNEGGPELTVQAKGGGWFDVVDTNGAPVNEKALRKDEAEALATGA